MTENSTTRQSNIQEGGRGRVLIVDDDAFFTKVLGIILKGEDYRISVAGSLAEARRQLAQSPFDIILCDLRLPDGEEGVDFLKELRVRGNRIPFIMLTGYGEVDNYMVAMNAGATEYLNKPVASEELLAVIQNCLRSPNPRP